jgi:hypothetical protein
MDLQFSGSFVERKRSGATCGSLNRHPKRIPTSSYRPNPPRFPR